LNFSAVQNAKFVIHSENRQTVHVINTQTLFYNNYYKSIQ